MSHKDQLSNVLPEELVTTLFQPVVSLKTGAVIGYEALGRGSRNSIIDRSTDLLSLATKRNKQIELGLLFKKNAIKKIQHSSNNLLFFINVESNILSNYNFLKNLTDKLLTDYNIYPNSIVFQLTENTAINDYDEFKSVLEYCCDQGFRIALSNVGSRFSGMKTIKEIYPHFLKIDKDLIKKIDRDTFKQAIVNSFVSLATTTNIKIIAEGIETKAELETLIRLGVYGAQGYFLQKPCEDFMDIPNEVINTIVEYNDFLNNSSIYNNTYNHIGSIVEQSKSFNISTPCGVIKNYFEGNNIDGACIVNNNTPVGLMMSHNLDSSLAHQYGVALYYNRPISLIMDYSPLIVDYHTLINVVSEQAMSRSDKKIYDNIIVTKNSKYFGIVSVKKLLQYAISFEKSYARELNPLTQLPGNVIINRVLNDAITLNRICCILYFDLDNFKVYNDLYGFENGDKVIKLTAEIINECVKSTFPYTSFVGHIGGDDFVSLQECKLEDCRALCESIISKFDSNILAHFNEIDRKNKCIMAEDRNGHLKNFCLTSLSIAGFYGNPKSLNTVENFAQFMSVIKKDVKKINHSSYIIREIDSKLTTTIKK